MDFKELLKPYEEGGLEHKPVKRTMGTIVDYLLNKKNYPIDVVGGAVFQVFFWLDCGNEFKGNDKYGSKGAEMVTAIRKKCDTILQERLAGLTFGVFIQQYAKELKIMMLPAWKLKLINWWAGRNVLA